MPRRPPKAWFYACERSVAKQPGVTDPAAVCAWNWYHWMSEARRREILAGERFDPDDLDIKGGEGFLFDPKKERWIKKVNRRKLAKLSVDLKKTYDFMEELFRIWRKKKAPNYMFRYLSDTQEQIIVTRRKILELLGAT